LLAQHQSQAITFEIQFCKRSFLFSRKTSLTDGLNFADAVMGVMDAISLINGNKPSPEYGLVG
jgi:hypothetical protein